MNFKLTYLSLLLVLLCNTFNSLAQTNELPVVEAEGDQLYCPGESIKIATSVTITDVDNTGTETMFVQISEGYQNGQDLLTLSGSHPLLSTSWDATAGKLTLNSLSGGEVLYTDFIAALLDVEFSTTNTNASGEKSFSITWGDANFLPSTGHFYEFVPSLGITWSAARNDAQTRDYFGLQGYLATLTSQEEADLSGEQANGVGWIGATDEAVEGVWRWVTGPEAGLHFWTGTWNNGGVVPGEFEFWNANEPNQAGNEDYAHITHPSNGNPDGSWNDLPNTGATDPTSTYHPQGYIVEYGGMPGEPDINISASTKITIPEITNLIPIAICGTGIAILEATSDFGVVNWYDSTTSSTPLFTGNSFTSPSISSTTIYYASAAIDASCSGGIRIPVIATVNPIPTIDSVNGETICFNGVGNLEATATAGSEINWYDVAVGGTSLGIGTTFTTPSASTTTTYYVDATLNGCTTLTRTSVELTVLSPAAPTGDVVQTFCDIDNATIADLTTLTGTNILWYDAVTGGNVLNSIDTLINGQSYFASQNDGLCESIDRLQVDVTLHETVIATAITPLEECDNTSVGTDTDGFIEIDLTQKETEMLNGQNTSVFQFSYFRDIAHLDPIATPSLFQNDIASGQPIYVRIENINDATCYTDVEFNLTIFELPTTNPPSIYTQCDDASNNGLAFFNLTLDAIKAEIAPNYLADNLVFTYYNSNTDAQDETNPISSPENYENSTPFVTETVWIRIENSNSCFRIETIDLEVTPSSADLANYNPTPIYQCDDGTDVRDGIATFDLTTIHDEIRDVIFPTITVTVHFYESLTDAELENNEIVDIANHQNTNSPYIQDIWVRVKSDLGNDCLGLEDFPTLLNVEALPFANTPTLLQECDDDNSTPAIFPFDTSNVTAEILGSQNLTDITITYFNEDGTSITTPTPSILPNPFITESQTIEIVVTNNSSNDPDGPCTDTTFLEFIVDDLPEASIPTTDYTLCDDEPDPNDGISEFDTSTLESEILNGQTGMNVNYFDANGNPLTDSNGISINQPFPNTFSSVTQTITVEVENPVNTICTATIIVDFTVNPNPIFDLLDEDMVCENILPHTVSVENPDQTDYLYQWYDASNNPIPGPEGTSETLTILSADDITSTGVQYSVTATNPTTLCSTTKMVQLWKSSIATITDEDIVTVEFSSPDNSIEILTANLGTGDYEFALEHDSDSRSYQDEPLFTGLEGGVYTLLVNDKNGCGEISHEIVLLDYPKFLTPNNDGQNDTWQLVGLESNSFTVSPIQIHDRYGKIVAVLNPYGDGWDGYFNGKTLPSTDYWFSLQLTDTAGNIKNYQGHFSLIRR